MDKLDTLTELTATLSDTLDEVASLNAALARAKAEQRRLQEDVIPDAMRDAGQDLLKMPDGKYLSLEDEVKARIPKNAADEAYAWLEEHGEGGMIKRCIVCEFRRDQEDEAQAALEALRRAGFHHATMEKTHAWNTFQSWVEKKLEEGGALPLDLFGIHQRTIAKVKHG